MEEQKRFGPHNPPKTPYDWALIWYFQRIKENNSDPDVFSESALNLTVEMAEMSKAAAIRDAVGATIDKCMQVVAHYLRKNGINPREPFITEILGTLEDGRREVAHGGEFAPQLVSDHPEVPPPCESCDGYGKVLAGDGCFYTCGHCRGLGHVHEGIPEGL